MKSAAVNDGVQTFIWVPAFISFVYILRSGISRYIILWWTFWGTSIPFSIEAAHFPFPPAMRKFPVSPHPCQTLVFCFFDESYHNRCEEISPCGFDLHSPNDLWCWTSFQVLTGHCFIIWGKRSLQVLLSSLNWVVLLLSFRNSLYILDMNPSSSFVNISSHSVGCLFTLSVVSLMHKVLNFDEAQYT